MPPVLKLRRRLKGAALGLAMGAFLGALLCWMHVVPAFWQAWRDAPRLAVFNQQCAHPVIGNPATFDHTKAGQGACEAFPAVVKASSFHSAYERNQWQYWLSIGNQILKDEDGRNNSGNPEAIGDVTEDLGWKNRRPIPVYALFWKGVLMSIYSRKYGYGTRMQTVSNPSTARRNVAFWGSASRVAYPMCLLGLFAAFLGYCVAEKKIETDENGPTPADKANAERHALPLPSDEAALQVTGRNAVWLLQAMFLGLQATMIGLGLTTYNQALHPPKAYLRRSGSD